MMEKKVVKMAGDGEKLNAEMKLLTGIDSLCSREWSVEIAHLSKRAID